MFKPLALEEGYPNPEGAKTDVMGAPTKKNLEQSTTEGKCDSDSPNVMDHDSISTRR